MRQLAAYQTFEPFSNPPAEALARRVAGLAPVAGARVFFTPGGGSDAIDTAAKLARAYWRAAGQPGKQVIISRSHAYHGQGADLGLRAARRGDTYSAHPTACAVGLANLDLIEREQLVDRVAALEPPPSTPWPGVVLPDNPLSSYQQERLTGEGGSLGSIRADASADIGREPAWQRHRCGPRHPRRGADRHDTLPASARHTPGQGQQGA